MDDEFINKLSEVIQSSQINFLIGAGASTPFLPLLGDIEKALNSARTISEREEYYKLYLQDVMLPNKKIVKSGLTSNADFMQTTNSF